MPLCGQGTHIATKRTASLWFPNPPPHGLHGSALQGWLAGRLDMDAESTFGWVGFDAGAQRVEEPVQWRARPRACASQPCRMSDHDVIDRRRLSASPKGLPVHRKPYLRFKV